MERIFTYDVQLYRKKLITRLIIVLISFLAFLVWNYFQIQTEFQTDFLKIFIPLSIFLAVFLYRNFNKQVRLLSETAFVLRGKSLIQFEGKIEVNDLSLKDLVRIQVGIYKSFPRVILEWEERAISLINLKDYMDFVILIEKATNIKHELNEQNGNFFNRKMFYFLLPSILFCIFVILFYNKKIAYANQSTLFLFVNINLLIYFLYGVNQKEEAYTGIYQTRRKIIFILVTIFFYQVFLAFSDSLGML